MPAYSDSEIRAKAEQLKANGVPLERIEAFVAEAKGLGETSLTASYGTQGGGTVSPPAGRPDFGGIGKAASLGADLMLEGVLPGMGQAAAARLAGPVGSSLAGSYLSGLGNALAQYKRLALGEQGQWSQGQNVAAREFGAIPFAGPAMNAGRVIQNHPLLMAGARVGAQALKGAGLAAASTAEQISIDEGRVPTMKELAFTAAFAGGVGGLASGVGETGKFWKDRSVQLGKRIEELKGTDLPISPGLAFPEQFAATEQRLASRLPGGSASVAATNVLGSFQKGVQGITPTSAEEATIFKAVSPLLGQIDDAKKTLDDLHPQVTQARKVADKALKDLEEARTLAADPAAIKAKEAESLKAIDLSFNAQLDAIAENARLMEVEDTVKGVVGLDPAVRRALAVKHVLTPTKAALDRHSDDLYSRIPNDVEGFDPNPILQRAEDVAAEASTTAGRPKVLSAALDDISKMLTSKTEGGEELIKNVSLQRLRNVREALYGKLKGEVGSDNERRLIKEVAGEITDQIKKQAVSALGEEHGSRLLAANDYYASVKPLLEADGVEALFKGDLSDKVAGALLGNIYEMGVNAPQYQNVMRLLDKVGEFRPKVREYGIDFINKLVKQGVVHDTYEVDIGSTSPNGLVVNGKALLKKLEDMARIPGTLETFGLGNVQTVAEMKRLFEKYPSASKFTPEEWGAIIRSDQFQKGGAATKQFADSLSKVLATSQAEKQLARSAAISLLTKDTDLAQRSYYDALNTVRSVNGDLDAAKARLQTLKSDEVAQALNNPNFGSKNFQNFAKSLFDTSPGVVENKEVKAVAEALRNSKVPEHKQALAMLQEWYIADRLQSFSRSPRYTTLPVEPDASKFHLFFNPTDPKNAAAEIRRAEAFLEPKQIDQMRAFSRAAKAISEYEQHGDIGLARTRVPVNYKWRIAMEGIADLVDEQKWHLLAWSLAHPSSYKMGAGAFGTTLGMVATVGKEQTMLALARNPMLRAEVEERERKLNPPPPPAPPQTQQPAPVKTSQFEPGKRYRDAQGNLATYNGTEFTPIT